ncbi:MAG TPA: Fic family protein, partial [Gordonia sp. (in: high G+C Gram-positive bacteria)]|nr:Fic family protein [Gordonia sp. (in: high G+C Gram-positive bacteria)]
MGEPRTHECLISFRCAGSDSTRTFDTIQGTVTYDELNDLIAEPYRRTLDAVLDGEFDNETLSVDLLRELHRRFVGPVMPGIAGVWRSEQVAVGCHQPPHPRAVDREMRAAMDDFVARIPYLNDDPEHQVEALAQAECSFLNVHPFRDFNGRVVRLFCWFVAVRHFRLPVRHTWVDAGTPEDIAYRTGQCHSVVATGQVNRTGRV